MSLSHYVDHRVVTALDTVIIDLDDRRLTLIWRVCLPLPEGPHDVRAVEVTCPASLELPRSSTTDRPLLAANHHPHPQENQSCP